jgi:hypothetical protein
VKGSKARELPAGSTPPAPLDQEARQEAQAAWALLSCSHCGTIHPGMCPRVKGFRVELRYPGGATEIREFRYFDHDEWEIPEGARTMFDVFGATKVMPPQPAPAPPQAKKQQQ